EGITWQVTRQTHLTRFHELRMRRLDPLARKARKRADADLAEDLRAANEYTSAEKTLRAEILIAFAAGLSAVFGVVFWAYVASPTRRLLAHWGARPAGDDAREAQCLLERLAVRADVAIPNLYVMDQKAPTAFALGLTPQTSVIAVSTGLLALLEPSELEAILARELSHVANSDTLPDTLLAGLALLAPAPRLMALLRNFVAIPDRETLADADATELTRDPKALQRAREKLGNPESARSASVTSGA
ncbi:MAG TPA: M48 family metalloprotease, partial [Candidatus Sulfopaludibacter sp.]|nr:M48 family metalloprotease [Candidatus Sulfopaludibacter sp.]